MAIEFKKTTYKGHTPEIWRGECKMLPGGFKPKNTISTGTVLNRGTLCQVFFETMEAAVVKVAKVLTGGTTSKARVAKGHLFAVGDVVAKNGGSVVQTVNSVDTSNAEYDVLNLAGAVTGLAADDVLVESEAPAQGETTKAKYTPNMVVGAVKEFNGKGLPTIDAAYEAVVLYPSLNYPVLDEWLNGCCLKSNPNILFIKQ
jgi:hypothetical protein